MSLESIQLATHNGDTISIADVMSTMKASGGITALETALTQVIAKRFADENSIIASTGELQAAADEFRQLGGLQKAEDMRRWLEQNGQTLEDFEASLEHSIVEDKLRKHLATDNEIERIFLAERSNLERVELAQVAVSDAGQASEIFAQLQEEELEFSEAVARFEPDEVAKRQNGYLGWITVCDLSPELQNKIRAASSGDVVEPTSDGEMHVIIKIWSKEEPKLDDELRAEFQEAIYEDWLSQRLEECNVNPGLGIV